MLAEVIISSQLILKIKFLCWENWVTDLLKPKSGHRFNGSASVGQLRPASPIRYTYLIARLYSAIAPALLY